MTTPDTPPLEVTRIVQVRPGDVLIFTGFQLADDDTVEVVKGLAEKLKEVTGVRAVAFFEDEVNIESLSESELRELYIRAMTAKMRESKGP